MLDVLLVYEHKVREIETIIALKLLLEKKGLSVDIIWVRDYKRFKYFFYNKPKLIVTPYLYSNKEVYDTVISICGNMNKVLNLQWEQIFNGKSTDTTNNPKEIAKYASHICWGDSSYNRLKSTGVQNLFLTGAPQLDFLKPAFDDYFFSKEQLAKKYHLDIRKKWILFISSFSYYNLSDCELDEIQSFADFNVYDFRTLTIKTKDEVIEWFKKFLSEHQDCQIIYRPHPAETNDEYLNNITNDNNAFRIISEESVKQWIKVSDVVLNWYSTSGVESYFAGKENYFLRPYTLSDDIEYKMYINSPKIKNYEEMVKVIYDENIGERKISQKVIDDINEFYLYTDEYACVNIVNKIIEMLKTKDYDIKTKLCSKRVLIKTIGRNLLKNIVIKISLSNAKEFEIQTFDDNIVSRKLIKTITVQNAHMKDFINKEEIEDISNRMRICVEKLNDE